MELESEYEVDLATLNLKFLHIGKRVKFASYTVQSALAMAMPRKPQFGPCDKVFYV